VLPAHTTRCRPNLSSSSAPLGSPTWSQRPLPKVTLWCGMMLTAPPAPLQVGTGLAAVVHRFSESTWSLVGDLMFAKDQNGRPDFGPGNLETCAGPARPDVGSNTADELIGLVQACNAIQDDAAAARQAEVMSVIGDRAMVDAAICFFPDADSGPKCMSMDDCRPGETCGSAGSCVIAVRCGGAQDCRSGEACVDAVCQVRR
jgi:hypothetical protein